MTARLSGLSKKKIAEDQENFQLQMEKIMNMKKINFYLFFIKIIEQKIMKI